MKIAIKQVALCLALLTASCSGFLDKEPISEVVDEFYWTSQEDARSAVAGSYGLLRAALANHSAYYAYGDVAGTGVFSAFIDTYPDWPQLNEFRLDYAVPASDPERPMKQLRNYRLFFRVINQCNRALKKIGQMDDALFDEGMKERLTGELYFLRGYSYFTMYRVWGEVPVVTVSPDDLMDAAYTPRAPLSEVAGLVYGDFEESLKRLPWQYPDAGEATVRASRGVVFAALAHMAAWDGDYVKCVSACDSVLASPLYALEDEASLRDIFENNSAELIFQLYFGSRSEAPAPTSSIYYQPVFFLDLLASPYLTAIFDKTQANMQLNENLLNNTFNDTLDARRATFIGASVGGKPICTKYTDIQELGGTQIYITNNYVIFRLADIMLLKAEALTARGRSSDVAISLLNQVRRRAGLPDFSGATSLQRAILDERFRELFLEGHRFFDLVRYYRVTGNSLFNNITETDMARGKHYWPLDPDLFDNNDVIRQTSFWQGKI
ncbi:MAG: RagB/SusD family nutrient uptake outer membrane protein [Odoribacteraceae bacterium]|nr:RagB/SusD family nutrient uptake outer membrane protein [Odoribacteraceae bacterium]